MANGLKIRMLGDIEITHGNSSLLPKLSSKSIAIIALLLGHANHKMTRERIASMLWADSFETANYNLRYNLWNLKKVIPQDKGEDFIISTKEACGINPAYRFSSDVTRLERVDAAAMERMDTASLRQVKAQLQGEFMDQFYIRDSEAFNDWTLFERAKYQKLYVQCLNILLTRYTEEESLDLTVEILEEMLLVNPYDEETHYRLMEAYVRKGSRYLAILQYKKCNALLREELNIVPQQKIKELYASIIDADREAREKAAGSERKKAVVLILNEYADPELPYLAMSQLLDRITGTLDKVSLEAVPQRYWKDVCAIYPDAQVYAGGEASECDIRDIRLFQSLRGILGALRGSVQLEIQIKNCEQLDPCSRRFFALTENTLKIQIQYQTERG